MPRAFRSAISPSQSLSVPAPCAPSLASADRDGGALERSAARVKDLTTDHLWPGPPRRLGRALDRFAEVLGNRTGSWRWLGSVQGRRAGEVRRSQHAVAGNNRNNEKPGCIGSIQDVATTIRRRALVT